MSLADLQIRWMMRDDLPQVLAIENDLFEYPWSEEDFIRTLRRRNCIGMVADAGGAEETLLIGFMIYELGKRRIRLLSLSVHPAYQRCGVGRALVDKLKTKLFMLRRPVILAEVCDSNLDAHLFFRAQGFRAVSVLRSFFLTPDGAGVDAYAFRYFLPDPLAGAPILETAALEKPR